MKKIKILYLATTLSLVACSPPAPVVPTHSESDKLDARICMNVLGHLQNNIKEKQLNIGPSDINANTASLIAVETARFYQDIIDNYENSVLIASWDSLKDDEKIKHDNLYIKGDCSEFIEPNALANYLANSRVDSPYKYDEAKKVDMQESLTSMNKEIDNTLDNIIDDYKKKAKRHWVSSAAGHFKVDAFELKNGEVVYCKTSITDAGKAVDCN